MEFDDMLSAEEIQTVQIYHLPNEILCKIFDHLDLPEKLLSDEAFEGHANVQSCLWKIFKLAVEKVCERNPLDFIDRPLLTDRPFTDLLKILPKSGQQLRTLGFDLNGCGGKKFKVIYNDVKQPLDDWGLERFLQCAIDHCNNLRSLKLHLVSPVDIEFCKLIKANEKLENILLNVSNMNQWEYQLLSKALESFPKLNKNLLLLRDKDLDAADCLEVKMHGTFNLEKLDLHNFFGIHEKYFKKLVAHNLKILHLGSFMYDYILLAGIDMKAIAEFKNLTELKITSIQSFDASVVMPLVLKGCTSWKNLPCRVNQENVSTECTNTIMTSSVSLKTVELVYVEMQSLLLDGATSKIELLLIENCTFNPKREIWKVKYFPYLKKLNLTAKKCISEHLSIENVQFQISDADLSAISENCRKLEEMILYVQSTQSTNGIASFADLPKLQSCEFSNLNCTTIYPEKTITSIVELQSACGDGHGLARHFCGLKLPISNLRSLKLSKCIKLSESSLIQAVSHMPYLETFNIDDCYSSSMTDEVITNLITFCRKLRILNLRGCRAVTASGIIALKDCLSLVTLRLVGLEIQPFSLSDLVKPNLKCLHLFMPQNLSIDFVIINSITEEMKKSMFTVTYNGERLI